MVNELYPHNFHKTDKQGRPISIDRIGKLNYPELMKTTSKDRLYKHWI